MKNSMKTRNLILLITLLLSFHSSATTKKGMVIKIFPDKLAFPTNCETWANPLAEEFSLLLTCNSAENKQYFFNFRLNNIDFTTNPNVTRVIESKFKSYTQYELTDKDSDGNQRTSFHYCTKPVCLDLVGDFEKAVVDSISKQLRE